MTPLYRLCGNGRFSFIPDSYFQVRAWWKNGKPAFLYQGDVLEHSPLGLVDTIFDRVTDAGKTVQIGRKEAEEIRILRCFYHERVLKIDHVDTLFSDTCCFQDSVTSAVGYFFGAVIVCPYNVMVTFLRIVTDRAFSFDDAESVFLRESDQLIEFYFTLTSNQAIGHRYVRYINHTDRRAGTLLSLAPLLMFTPQDTPNVARRENVRQQRCESLARPLDAHDGLITQMSLL